MHFVFINETEKWQIFFESLFFLFFLIGAHVPIIKLQNISDVFFKMESCFFFVFFIQSNIADIVRNIPINPMETIISSSYPITNSHLQQQPELSNVAAHEAFIQKFSQVKKPTKNFRPKKKVFFLSS
jgi:hypothetical protein